MATNATDQDVSTYDLPVEGMTCGSCAARVQRTLLKQPGVAGADVNYGTGLARVVVDDAAVDLPGLQAAVAKTG
jgi:copper-transporting P-type ATPase V